MRVAAVDIGTNSVRLLVADSVDGRLHEVSRHAVITRLGEGVDATGSLSRHAIERTVAELAKFGATMGELGVERSRAVATSASRDAANVAEFLASAATALGVMPEVIDGAVEAALSFAGASAGRLPTKTLVIDAGGGSTEFVVGITIPEYANSVDIGSVRLTERMASAPPVAPEIVHEARALVASKLSTQLELPPADLVIGVAGTFSTLAAIHLDLPEYSRVAVDGTILAANDLGLLVERLASMSIAQIAAIPSMDPARAPVILGGAIVVEQALLFSGHGEVLISESDILDGVAMSTVQST